MVDAFLHLYILGRMQAADVRERLVDERGEGVISAAIAVLIMAFLGAAMWAAFNALFRDAAAKIQTNVGNIGG